MKIGISGFDSDLRGTADFFEIDAHDSESLHQVQKVKASAAISANHFYFMHADHEVFQDRVEILFERASRIQANYCLLKLPPSFFQNHSLESRISRFLKKWKELEQSAGVSSIPVYIDLPQCCPKVSSKGFEFARDPLWTVAQKSKCWKIHGWHDARWIRMYSEQDLLKLKKMAIQWKPEFLVFGHSQRVIQLKRFLLLD